jgi:hypothetical protein
MAEDIKCTLRIDDDWCVIEREAHDGRSWLEKTEYGHAFMCSARISDADVEGTREEMEAIAHAIETGDSDRFKRCAASRNDDGSYVLFSPRNSRRPAHITAESAKYLAANIRRVLAETPIAQAGE